MRKNHSLKLDKFLYKEEPPESDQTDSSINRIKFVNERMAGIPTKPVDSSERYKNIRDLE
ncbi:MAG TPA: hypothetical protein VJ250_09080 [Nitrososphaeraceae archaeon]|nr:hypothetical protein [Nitrososphaeraceae archaeon]